MADAVMTSNTQSSFIGAQKALVVWRLLDGKPGHENQTLGFVGALKRRCPSLSIFDINVSGRWSGVFAWLTGRFSSGRGMPRPDLLIGAGHTTHFSLLAARSIYGGRVIVLMRPSLPMRLFDLCVIPEHDGINEQPGVFVSKGVLNSLTSEGTHRDDQCLMLVGGPSSHYGWSDESLLKQVKQVVKASPQMHFILTTSRRTPSSFCSMVRSATLPNLMLVPYEETPPGWVAKTLSESKAAWVTADSVSMVYEALSSGVSVAVFDVPIKREGESCRG